MKREGQWNILVVDDIESIRTAMKDFLSNSFHVQDAKNGIDALKILEQSPVDMVLTDIRMPEMDGIELIQKIQYLHPQVRYALMTAYNVDDYIGFAREHQIWNIIPKTTFLNLKFVKIMIQKILSGDIFGIEKYTGPMDRSFVYDGRTNPDLAQLRSLMKSNGPDPFIASVIIKDGKQNNQIGEIAGKYLIQSGAPAVIQQIIEELTSNALTRAPNDGHATTNPFLEKGQARNKSGKELPKDQISPAEQGPIQLEFGKMDQQVFLSVTDYHGTLNRSEILYRLERQVKMDPMTGLPVGIGDLHGRGLYISREHSDQLIFNVEPGVKTEVIAILDLDADFRNRAISIYCSDPS